MDKNLGIFDHINKTLEDFWKRKPIKPEEKSQNVTDDINSINGDYKQEVTHSGYWSLLNETRARTNERKRSGSARLDTEESLTVGDNKNRVKKNMGNQESLNGIPQKDAQKLEEMEQFIPLREKSPGGSVKSQIEVVINKENLGIDPESDLVKARRTVDKRSLKVNEGRVRKTSLEIKRDGKVMEEGKSGDVAYSREEYINAKKDVSRNVARSSKSAEVEVVHKEMEILKPIADTGVNTSEKKGADVKEILLENTKIEQKSSAKVIKDKKEEEASGKDVKVDTGGKKESESKKVGEKRSEIHKNIDGVKKEEVLVSTGVKTLKIDAKKDEFPVSESEGLVGEKDKKEVRDKLIGENKNGKGSTKENVEALKKTMGSDSKLSAKGKVPAKESETLKSIGKTDPAGIAQSKEGQKRISVGDSTNSLASDTSVSVEKKTSSQETKTSVTVSAGSIEKKDKRKESEEVNNSVNESNEKTSPGEKSKVLESKISVAEQKDISESSNVRAVDESSKKKEGKESDSTAVTTSKTEVGVLKKDSEVKSVSSDNNVLKLEEVLKSRNVDVVNKDLPKPKTKETKASTAPSSSKTEVEILKKDSAVVSVVDNNVGKLKEVPENIKISDKKKDVIKKEAEVFKATSAVVSSKTEIEAIQKNSIVSKIAEQCSSNSSDIKSVSGVLKENGKAHEIDLKISAAQPGVSDAAVKEAADKKEESVSQMLVGQKGKNGSAELSKETIKDNLKNDLTSTSNPAKKDEDSNKVIVDNISNRNPETNVNVVPLLTVTTGVTPAKKESINEKETQQEIVKDPLKNSSGVSEKKERPKSDNVTDKKVEDAAKNLKRKDFGSDESVQKKGNTEKKKDNASSGGNITASSSKETLVVGNELMKSPSKILASISAGMEVRRGSLTKIPTATDSRKPTPEKTIVNSVRGESPNTKKFEKINEADKALSTNPGKEVKSTKKSEQESERVQMKNTDKIPEQSDSKKVEDPEIDELKRILLTKLKLANSAPITTVGINDYGKSDIQSVPVGNSTGKSLPKDNAGEKAVATVSVKDAKILAAAPKTESTGQIKDTPAGTKLDAASTPQKNIENSQSVAEKESALKANTPSADGTKTETVFESGLKNSEKRTEKIGGKVEDKKLPPEDLGTKKPNAAVEPAIKKIESIPQQEAKIALQSNTEPQKAKAEAPIQESNAITEEERIKGTNSALSDAGSGNRSSADPESRAMSPFSETGSGTATPIRRRSVKTRRPSSGTKSSSESSSRRDSRAFSPFDSNSRRSSRALSPLTSFSTIQDKIQALSRDSSQSDIVKKVPKVHKLDKEILMIGKEPGKTEKPKEVVKITPKIDATLQTKIMKFGLPTAAKIPKKKEPMKVEKSYSVIGGFAIKELENDKKEGEEQKETGDAAKTKTYKRNKAKAPQPPGVTEKVEVGNGEAESIPSTPTSDRHEMKAKKVKGKAPPPPVQSSELSKEAAKVHDDMVSMTNEINQLLQDTKNLHKETKALPTSPTPKRKSSKPPTPSSARKVKEDGVVAGDGKQQEIGKVEGAAVDDKNAVSSKRRSSKAEVLEMKEVPEVVPKDVENAASKVPVVRKTSLVDMKETDLASKIGDEKTVKGKKSEDGKKQETGNDASGQKKSEMSKSTDSKIPTLRPKEETRGPKVSPQTNRKDQAQTNPPDDSISLHSSSSKESFETLKSSRSPSIGSVSSYESCSELDKSSVKKRPEGGKKEAEKEGVKREGNKKVVEKEGVEKGPGNDANKELQKESLRREPQKEGIKKEVEMGGVKVEPQKENVKTEIARDEAKDSEKGESNEETEKKPEPAKKVKYSSRGEIISEGRTIKPLTAFKTTLENIDAGNTITLVPAYRPAETAEPVKPEEEKKDEPAKSKTHTLIESIRKQLQNSELSGENAGKEPKSEDDMSLSDSLTINYGAIKKRPPEPKPPEEQNKFEKYEQHLKRYEEMFSHERTPFTPEQSPFSDFSDDSFYDHYVTSDYSIGSSSPYEGRLSRRSSRCTSTPRRIFPQIAAPITLEIDKTKDESPVIFDAGLSFDLCPNRDRTPVRQLFQPQPAFSEPKTVSNTLSTKIADFLSRTDHVMEEWKRIGKSDSGDLKSLVELPSYASAGHPRSKSKSATNIMIKGLLNYSRGSSVSSFRSPSRSRYSESSDRTLSDLDELSEMAVDLTEERATGTLQAERLEAETAERIRLEQELSQIQHEKKNLQQTSERLEMELFYARADVNGLSEGEADLEDGNGDVAIYKQKCERIMRELEFTRRRLQQQHEDDLEQLVGLKKQLEKKLADAYEEVEEQRQVVGQWKRKVQKLQAEMNDLRLLLEEQSSRNNLLEKKQRKFDSEIQMLQDELRSEKNQRDRASREKEIAVGEKYAMEQNLSSVRLELELKEEKLASLTRELDELTRGGGSEQEVTQLRKAKHDLDLKLKEQEEELDELAGQVSMLEGNKLRLEMSLESLRKDHRREMSQRDDELDEVRSNAHKKVKALESQLESEHEERTLLLREKHELERRLNDAEERGRHYRAADEDALLKLRRDLKKTKALLRDAQVMLDRAKQDSPSKAALRQLKNQLEDAELARASAVKAKQSLESELSEVSGQLEEALRAKGDAENRCQAAQRESNALRTQVDENEEELAELLKKYRQTVQQLSAEQLANQETAGALAEAEAERASLRDQLAELTAKLEASSLVDPASGLAQKRLEIRIKELESRLELEQTTRGRLEVQITRLKENVERLTEECAQARTKEQAASDLTRKLQRSLREAKEELAQHQAKEQEFTHKRKELEKRLETAEQEAMSARTDLRLAVKRIEDLQNAISGEIGSDSEGTESEGDSDSGDDSLISQLPSGLSSARTSTSRTPDITPR